MRDRRKCKDRRRSCHVELLARFYLPLNVRDDWRFKPSCFRASCAINADA